MRLLLLSEGPRDIGDVDETSDTTPRQGAVRVLVRRVLEAEWKREIASHEIDVGVLARVHRESPESSGYERKVELAITEARTRDMTCVAIVVDRDGPANAGRIKGLEAGREQAAQKGELLAEHTALGVAVEVVEAWLLADEAALNSALSLDPPQPALPLPEGLNGRRGTLDHPKTLFRHVARRGSAALSAAYDDVPGQARLEHLETRCPSFGRFAKEVRTRCC